MSQDSTSILGSGEKKTALTPVCTQMATYIPQGSSPSPPISGPSLFQMGPELWPEFGPSLARVMGSRESPEFGPSLSRVWAELCPEFTEFGPDFGPSSSRVWPEWWPEMDRVNAKIPPGGAPLAPAFQSPVNRAKKCLDPPSPPGFLQGCDGSPAEPMCITTIGSILPGNGLLRQNAWTHVGPML